MARTTYESTSFPYMLFKNTYATIYTTESEDRTVLPESAFNYNFDSNIISSANFLRIPFTHLMKYDTTTFATDNNFYLGIGYLNYNINGVYETPIDLIVNNSAINTVATFYNNQPATFNYTNTVTDNRVIKHILKNENINYIIKYLRLVNSHIMPKSKALYTNSSSKVYQLYNDTVEGEPFAQYIYRAKLKRNDIGFGSNATDKRLYNRNTNELAKVPVFRVETTDQNLYFYISIRNYKIPMKRVQTNSITYIYICPEYILKKYIEHTDAINYIIANHAPQPGCTYIFTYDYLYGAHLWYHDKTDNEYTNYGVKLGNTNSSVSFRKVS